MTSPQITNVYVLASRDDLAGIEKRLGATHALAERLRASFDSLHDERDSAYRQAAAAQARGGELEVDPNAIVSKSDDAGAYVMSWVWVSDGDLDS
jgi:hypothetical protein